MEDKLGPIFDCRAQLTDKNGIVLQNDNVIDIDFNNSFISDAQEGVVSYLIYMEKCINISYQSKDIYIKHTQSIIYIVTLLLSKKLI